MTDVSAVPQPRADAGTASAENGLVVLDGPDGVAVTMTPNAARLTGQSLISAAQCAEQQAADQGEIGND
ncbi:hypothetical protein C1T17_16000 [Sphingobium sp. SCG-1]|uniref:hypothetical protein n=1 Tax=Sphingobium sp. SCG-1 TaxID=2072936 RepID=UPI000CD6C462|nr:hypothetical protein [Sphingobium sp. SCG-1]AUW59366.1 hypothetical protein C1T17_16000 [Sphingobium sp. SCG-1]